jgi:hypothetical protein
MEVAGYRGADERTVNEVAGWLFRCAFQSAAHMTDYVIDVGTAYMLGGSRTAELTRMCVRAGLLTAAQRNGTRVYRLIADPEFIHIKLREEVEWERQQRNDTRDPALTVPVRRRDGDNCRWCGVLVQWRGRKSRRTAVLDHLVPGQAGTPETMHVACWGCNSSRKDNPQWDDDHPLRPAPAAPRYGVHTAAFLTDNGYPTVANVTSDQARAPEAENAAPAAQRPASAPSDRTRSERPADGQEVDQKSPPKSAPHSDETSSAGSGLDGSASGPGSGADGGAPPARRRRSRRGGQRNRPRTADEPTTPLCPIHHQPEPCTTCQHEYDTEGDTP